MKKTAILKATVSPEVKKRLLEKCKEIGLTLTSYLEKIANEPIIFLDKNALSMLRALNLHPKR